MAVTCVVSRGYTAVAGTPITVADFNAGFLPSVVIEGTFLSPGGVVASDCKAGAYFSGASGGTLGAYTLALTPAPTGYTNAMWCSFVANHANPGAATLAINTLGAKALVNQSGQPLTGAEIVVGEPVWAQFYTTGDHFRMLSNPAKRKVYAEDTGVADACVVAIADWPVSTTLTLAHIVGIPIWWKVNVVNSGATTLAVNGTAATAIRSPEGRPMSAGELTANSIVCTVYDGTYHRLMAGGQATTTAVQVGTTIDWALARHQHRLLDASVTFLAFANADEGRETTLWIKQAASGGPYTVSWDAGLAIKWAGAAAPLMATTANRVNAYSFVKVGGVVYGLVSANHG